MMIVSFSGIDGAGKSTQISALEAWLHKAGLRSQRLSFWDDIVAYAGFRESMSYRAFKGDQGIGSPEKPLRRRDKNVTSWPLTAVRFFFYFADAVSLCWRVHKLRKNDIDVIIFDRYIYDELANLPPKHWPVRLFVKFILSFMPKPSVAYVIDADPVAAIARKPEYPLEFLRSNREAYLNLSRLAGHITVIEPLPIAEGEKKVREVFLQELSCPEATFSGQPTLQ